MQARERARLRTAQLMAAQREKEQRIETLAAEFYELSELEGALLAKLAANQEEREAIIDRLRADLSVKEVAELLGVEERAVRRRRIKAVPESTGEAVPLRPRQPLVAEQDAVPEWPANAGH